MAAGILASAVLSFLYARGGAGWLLGFVALVPWLLTLDASRTLAGALLGAWIMSVAYTLAVFAWFGFAVGQYTQLGAATGLAVLLLAAPLFQPQFLACALLRHVAGRRHGRLLGAVAGTAAWVAAEGLLPRMLGDTLAHGLYPSALLRQAADLGGAAGLTALLLVVNEALTAAVARRAQGLRALALPLALAALVPLLLAGYGAATLSAAPATAGQPLRLGLVQSNIFDYERLRQEKGAGAVVREVLDVHYAMSHDAVERQRVDAVLWSETVYPTTFGHPKSEAGAELDREILDIVSAAGVPFVFGTYDRDAAGEYNAAAFVVPGTGLLGMYRKTRLFPFTEFLPAWLDGPTVRRWLPWAGAWLPGSGARVFPLRLADGREIPVLPLICLDDMDPGLAIEGARLGAQAILALSNDSWFTSHPQGAELHLAAAAFRSIETRLPQFRVTTNGASAIIDSTGQIVAAARMGERTLVIGALPVQDAPPTLMLAWGDWVPRAAGTLLLLLAAAAALQRWWTPGTGPAGTAVQALPAELAVLPPAARIAAGALRAVARGSLLWMAAAIVFGDGTLQSSTLTQVRSFALLFLAPELAAWCVLRAYTARASIEQGLLVLARGAQRLALPLHDIAGVVAWRLPLPGPGAWLQLAGGQRWRHGLALADPEALAHVLSAAGAALGPMPTPTRATLYFRARQSAPRGRLASMPAKFALLPLALALPAFRLHQHITYGSSFGELHSAGLAAYLASFAQWWAAWVVGVALCAAVLRAAIEAAALVALLLRPASALATRRRLERLGLAALYLGLPGWLLLRVYAS